MARMPEDVRKKISNALMGNVPWNKGVRGAQVSWNKGGHVPEIVRKKISDALQGNIPWNKGIKHSASTIQKIKNSCKGRTLTEAHRTRLSIARRGRTPALGHRHTVDTKMRMSLALRGSKHPRWRGGMAKCVQCGKVLSGYKQARCKRCYGVTVRGAGNPRWCGGVSRLPYGFEFDVRLKRLIRARDGNKCCRCGMDARVHKNRTGRELHVHHIDYDKNNNSAVNLITLCAWCNSCVNSNREYWTRVFGEMEVVNAKRSVA